MNLDEKIARSIDAKFEQVLQMFNDVDDAQGGLGLLEDLHRQIPLLEDIKTEIKQLQDSLPVQGEAKEEPADDPANDPPPSDPETQDLRNRLKDAIDGLDKAKRLTSPLRQLLPSKDDPIPDWVKDVPWYDMASDVYKIYKLIKLSKEMNEKYDSIFTQLKDLFDGQTTWQEFWKEQEDESFDALNRVIEIMNSDLEEELERMFQLGDNISQNLEECCQNTSQNITQSTDDLLTSNAVNEASMVNLFNGRFL